ncbi:MAG: helix-turn-helix domain-containing protein [Streptosporangiales bacterium]|nr:helix-turn-helix domain-containing protein [Streptosporangiales bacterium]
MTAPKGARRGPEGLRALERATTILRTLAERPAGLSLVDLAKATELPMSTVHRLLGVLRQVDLVRETPAGLHALGPGTVVLAGAFLDGLDLRAEAQPAMRRIVDATGETCHLGVLAAAHIVYLEKIDSPQSVRMVSRVGGTNPALTTAIGRSILAYSPDEVVAETLEASERLLVTRMDPERLRHLLESVRRDGYSTDLEDNEVGICCVGAPIFDHLGGVASALSVSAPTVRFDRSRAPELGRLVRAEADTVSRALGWTGAPSVEGERG